MHITASATTIASTHMGDHASTAAAKVAELIWELGIPTDRRKAAYMLLSGAAAHARHQGSEHYRMLVHRSNRPGGVHSVDAAQIDVDIPRTFARRPRSNKASPAAGVAAASCAASLADFAQLLPKKGGTAASPTKGAASPAFIQPGSPASEATSEWSAHSGASAQASEKGTKPFGKQCPDLKKPTIFHVSAAPMVFVVVGGGDQSQKLCGMFFPGVFFPD